VSWSDNNWSRYYSQEDFVREVIKITKHLIKTQFCFFARQDLDDVVSSVMVHVLGSRYQEDKQTAVSSWLFNNTLCALKRIATYESGRNQGFNRKLVSERRPDRNGGEISSYSLSQSSSNDLWMDPYSRRVSERKRQERRLGLVRRKYERAEEHRIYSVKYGVLWNSEEEARKALSCSKQNLRELLKKRKTKKYGEMKRVPDSFEIPQQTEEQARLWRNARLFFKKEAQKKTERSFANK
jgi:hypothetical protein